MGEEERMREEFHFKDFDLLPIHFCINRDSAGILIQERAGGSTTGCGRGQYCHISNCRSTYPSLLNSICVDEVLC